MNGPVLRVDRWLWFARFFKSRSMATRLCQRGRVRVNGAPKIRASHPLRPGDVLTFPKDRHERTIRVVGLGSRRGPPPEAQALYEDLDPPQTHPCKRPPGAKAAPAKRPSGAGRPTKAERRAIDRLRGR